MKTTLVTEDGLRIVYRALLDREPDHVGMQNFLIYADLGSVIHDVPQSEKFGRTTKSLFDYACR